MSEKHPIDDLFRSKLEQHDMEPPMHLWAEIEKERNRRFLFFSPSTGRSALVAAFLLGTAALFAWWFVSSPAIPELGSFPLQASDRIAATESTTVPGEAVSIAATGNSAPLVPTATASLFPVLPKLNALPDQGQALRSVTENSNPPISTILPPSNADANLDAEEKITFDNLKFSLARALQEKEAPESIAGTAGIYGRKSFAPLVPLSNEISLLETGLFIPDPKCAAFKNSKPRIYLEALAGPEIASRKLMARDGEYDAYAASRRQTESSRFAFSTGIRISAVTNVGVALRTGINLTQIHETFDYLNENELQTIITDIFGPDGHIIRTDTVFITGANHKTTNNRFRTVDIPIILGYEFKYQNFTFAVNGGAYLNLNFTQRGQFLSPDDLRPVTFSSDTPGSYQAFKDRLGIGWYGSLGVHYQMTPRMHLLFEPSFRMYPKSVTTEGYVLDQRYSLTGLALGVRYAL